MPMPLTVSDVPAFTATDPPPPEELPPSPDDGDALAAFTDWCARWLWGDALPVPLAVESNRVRSWPRSSRHLDWPPPTPAEYARWASMYWLGVAGSAALTVEVAPSRWPFDPGDDLLMPVCVDRHVRLDSWRYLEAELDSDDLWSWSAAVRGDGQQAGKVRERALPGALATGQAVRDALAVTLPQVEETKTTKRAVRLGKW